MPPPRRLSLEEPALKISMELSPPQQFFKRTIQLLERDESNSSSSSIGSTGTAETGAVGGVGKNEKCPSWVLDLRSSSPLSASSFGSSPSVGFVNNLSPQWDEASPTANVRRESTKTPRSRFSLPTIQELKTYERDPEFAKLSDRPKRGLNLPRSGSMKPSVMSAALETPNVQNDGTDEDTNTEGELLATPTSLASLLSKAFNKDVPIELMSPISHPDRFSTSLDPLTPLHFVSQTQQKPRKAFFT